MAAYAAVVSLKATFSTLLHYCDAALPPEALKICESAHKELKWFQNFVERLGSRSRKKMSAVLGRIAEAVHEVSKRFDGGDILMEDFLSFIETLKKMREECCSLLLEDEEEVVSVSSSSSSKMIGFRDERSKLKESLVNDRSGEKTVILLHGMAGIGKTMLAREVFEDLDISEWFECRAWVTVGYHHHELSEIQVNEAILAQLDPDAHKMVMGGDHEEIALQLKESLNRDKRMLIVVDDVWDYDILRDSMERVLLDNIKSIRIILTSRSKASDGFSDHWYIFKKRLLNEEESWELLREKVFDGGSCPPQLEDTGKKIADKCDGLPLTIVIVADLLLQVEESLWIDVAEKKRHPLFIDAYDQISEVLYPSYKKLRDDFKLGFLYMAVFPLKYKIHRSKLFNLWAAEEIFNPSEERYSIGLSFLDSILSHFDDCSLIVVYQGTTTPSNLFESNETIRICGLHSSWWNLCQREVRKTKLFYVLDGYQDGLEEGIKSQTRLSMHNNVLFALKDVYNSMEENCASTVKSLLCFGPYNQYTVPMCNGLKLLQRLDALNIRFYDFPLEVLELAKLLYLALTCNGQLPPSISKLEKLKYLIVHPHLSIKSSGAPSYMPTEIWDLEQLKYLQVLGSDLPNPGDKSLEMLSTLLDVSTASCTVLKRLPKLVKLRIRIELAPEAQDPLCCFDGISNLEKLKSVTCIVVNPVFKYQVVPPVASFPVVPYALAKLSLSGSGYPWEEMGRIASSLSSLVVLKLQTNAFHGQIWELGKWDFQSLHFLLLEGLDLVKLKGGRKSFRSLRHLSIKHCYKLEEIQMKKYKKISRIEVVDSNPRVEKCIKELILETGHFPEHLSVHSSWKSA